MWAPFAGSDEGTSGLRLQLRLAALVASLVTLLTALGVMLGPSGSKLVMPGPLESFHAPLAERCDACHAKDPKSAMHGIVATEQAFVQSEKCLACHDLGPDALHAHGWEPGAWGTPESRAALAESGVPGALEGRFACTTCHHEHRGRERALARVSDAQCQSCHAEGFHSFESGHPEFGTYPYGAEATTAVAFDHAEHISTHFVDDPAAPDSCTDCHLPDGSGREMLVEEFAVSCAECHGGEIAGDAQIDTAGLAFLALPSLDVMTLEERGFAIGEWPSDAGVAETPLTPFLELLVAEDLEDRGDLQALADLDPLDLYEASDEELEAVARVAWTTKLLLLDLLERGHAAIRERLGSAIGRELDAEEAAAILGTMPAELLASAIEDWLPGLRDETERYLAGEREFEPADLESGGDVDRDADRESWVAAGGWYRREIDFSLRYRPTGHADRFLRGWLELTATREATRRVFHDLSDPLAVGTCTKCHLPGDDGRIRWQPAGGEHLLTSFSHAPHLVGLGRGPEGVPASNLTDGCLSCHEVAPAAASDIPSGFRPLSRETCASCHSEAGARSSCVDCHVYHDRSVERVLPDSPLR